MFHINGATNELCAWTSPPSNRPPGGGAAGVGPVCVISLPSVCKFLLPVSAFRVPVHCDRHFDAHPVWILFGLCI